MASVKAMRVVGNNGTINIGTLTYLIRGVDDGKISDGSRHCILFIDVM